MPQPRSGTALGDLEQLIPTPYARVALAWFAAQTHKVADIQELRSLADQWGSTLAPADPSVGRGSSS